MGIPLEVLSIGDDGFARCADARGEPYAAPINTALLDTPPAAGDWLLTHIDTAIRTLEAGEAHLIADALEAVHRAAQGQEFEHLLGDLLNREPELPEHLREKS